ncbi:prolactin-like [Erethizon dorsatum]
MSTLVLCQNVASHPTCLEGARCQVMLQDLLNNATYLTVRMHFNSLEVFLEFVKQYSQDVFVMTAVRNCPTTYIPAPAGQKEARLVEHKDIINTVIRYLLSWNSPLTYLVQEVHRLPKLHDFFKLKERIISELYHQLKELAKEIAGQLDPEATDDVDYAAWWGLHSLETPDEKSLLLTYYNMLCCLLTDLQKIESLLEILMCRVAPGSNCYATHIPRASEMVSNDSSVVKVI